MNNYYPFGMLHNYTVTAQNAYQYKYNGKELQETGMYDYGWRQYMPDIGRWGVPDPMAEQMTRWSPYNYAFDNPIKYIDIDGLAPGGPGDQGDGKTIRTQDIEEVVITVRRKTSNFFSRVWNGIQSAFTSQYSPKTNADKYGGLNSYRQWQGSPFYNEGETKMDRIFRLMGNSKNEEMLNFGGGAYNMNGGYGRVLSTETKVLNEAQSILKQEKALKKIFELGTGQEVKIGGRTIIVEPEAPMSGLTLFEENAFVIGKEAFSSPLELRKTILHELYRLNTSNLKGQNVTQGAVSGETKAAFDFAEKNAQKLK
ncbi:RHS repeat-associated protein [Chryseobacterium sp. H1D6B]|nr:RHS repeat-associated protein [Chryseobacterium sp. H1D6B]